MTTEPQQQHQGSMIATAHPVATLITVAVGLVWIIQMTFVLAGQDLMPAKLAELVLLVGLAVVITRATGGRPGIRRLFQGLTRWRLGWRYLLLVAAMPVLTVVVGLVTGTLEQPAQGWAGIAFTYVVFLVLGAVTANLWEETVWGGFVQARLMARHGLLVGSLLTAVPVFLIHLPLAWESQGWAGTTWGSVGITWAVLLVAAPFQRYLIGTLLVDTRGSTLAAGIMHASINAAGAMAVVSAGWQSVPALMLLTVAVGAYRVWRGQSAVDGYALALTPASEAAALVELGTRD